jgi:hypothetical protein
MSGVPPAAEFLVCLILSAYPAVMPVRFLLFHTLNTSSWLYQGISRSMKSLKRGTVKVVSPYTGL